MDLYCQNVASDNRQNQTAADGQNIKKAEELFNQGSQKPALLMLERMVSRNPQKIEAKQCLSRAYYIMASDLNETSKGVPAQSHKVIIFLKKSVQQDPRNGEAYLLLGQVYEKIAQEYNNKGKKGPAKSNFENASAAYFKADNLDPKGRAAIALASIYALSGKYDLAGQCLERFLVNNPQKLGETVLVLEKITAANPKDSKFLKLLAASYYNNKKLELAIQTLKKVVDLDPKNAENHSNLGMAYLAISEYDLSVDSLEKAVSIEPKNSINKKNLSQVCYVYANSQYFSGKISQAIWEKMIDLLLRAIEVDPSNKDSYSLLGKIYVDIAGVFERKALSDPTDANNKKNAMDYYRVAMKTFLECLKYDPRNEIVFDLVDVCFKLQEYKVALESAKKYYENTHDPKAKDILKIIELKIKVKGK